MALTTSLGGQRLPPSADTVIGGAAQAEEAARTAISIAAKFFMRMAASRAPHVWQALE